MDLINSVPSTVLSHFLKESGVPLISLVTSCPTQRPGIDPFSRPAHWLKLQLEWEAVFNVYLMQQQQQAAVFQSADTIREHAGGSLR